MPGTRAAERILVVKSQSSPALNQAFEGFRSSFRDPIREFELRGKPSSAEMSAMIGETKPELIVAFGLQAAEAARENASGLRLLFVMVANPKKRGLDASNIAGISLNIPAVMQFTNYTNVVRNLKRLGVIYDEKKTGDVIREAKIEAAKVGIDLVGVPVSSQRAVADGFKALLAQRIDALWMVADETVVTPASFRFLQKETSRNKLPFLAASEIFVEKGALASLSVDHHAMGQQAGELVQQLLKDPELMDQIKIVAPAKVNITLNLDTARELGTVVNEKAIHLAHKTYP